MNPYSCESVRQRFRGGWALIPSETALLISLINKNADNGCCKGPNGLEEGLKEPRNVEHFGGCFGDEKRTLNELKQ